MLEPGFYNMDCMEGMREFPDGFFTECVDLPRGDAGADEIAHRVVNDLELMPRFPHKPDLIRVFNSYRHCNYLPIPFRMPAKTSSIDCVPSTVAMIPFLV